MDTRARLLEAALDLLEADPSASPSLRAIARASGLSEAAPYRHFPNKAALMSELAGEGFRRLGEVLAPLEQRVELTKADVWQAYSAFAASQPALYALMHRLDPGQSTPSTSHRAFALAEFARLTRLAERLVSCVDAQQEAFDWWCAFHGRVEIERVGLRPPSLPFP